MIYQFHHSCPARQDKVQTFFSFGCSLHKTHENLRCKIYQHAVGYQVSEAWFWLLLSPFFRLRSMVSTSKIYLGWCRCGLPSGCPCGCRTRSVHCLLLLLPTPAHSTASSKGSHPPVKGFTNPWVHIPKRDQANTGKAYSNPFMHSLSRCQNKHSWEIHILFQWNLKSVRADHSLLEHRQRWKELKTHISAERHACFPTKPPVMILLAGQNSEFWYGG